MVSRPNVVFLTIDSVRQDHTTMGGYHRETTPNVQRIADSESGTAFPDCFAHATATPMSGPSILSGTYPSHHGTYYGDRSAFPDSLPTVAELLSDVGYHTAAFSNNGFVSDATGLDRGFDEFELMGGQPLEVLDSVGPVTMLKYLANIRRHSVGFDTDTHAHSAAYLVTDVVKRWLRRFQDDHEPFFLYAHYNETHRAYYPPLPYLDRFTDDIELSPSEAAETSMRVHHNLVDIIAEGCDLSEAEMEALIAMYDAEIAYTDELIGSLFDLTTELFDDTIFVVTSDHGELFGEHGSMAHKYAIHNALLRVPLVVHGVEGLDGEGLVQHSDAMATLLEIAGADTDSIQGSDLRSEERTYAISQDRGSEFDEPLASSSEFDTSRYCTENYSVIQDGTHKYVGCPDSPRLYELPDEDRDVTDENPEVADRLETALTDWLETEGQPAGEAETVEMDDAMQDHLADLGYLDSEM